MTKTQRIELAKTSLKGVSVGDAFGDSFFWRKGNGIKPYS